MPVEVVSIIVGVPDTLPESPKRNLEELESKVGEVLLKKSMVPETEHIVQRVMESYKKQDATWNPTK